MRSECPQELINRGDKCYYTEQLNCGDCWDVLAICFAKNNHEGDHIGEIWTKSYDEPATPESMKVRWTK